MLQIDFFAYGGANQRCFNEILAVPEPSMNEIEAIITEVQRNYRYAKELIQNARDNAEIAKKFFRIEKRILKILNYNDLFEALLTEISVQLKVPYAWITIIKGSGVLQFIQSKKPSEILLDRLNVVTRKKFEELVDTTSPLLISNDDLKRYKALMPKNRRKTIKSIAVAPLMLDGDLIGSLNQADTHPERWVPGMDTTNLKQLAIKLSLCLSNVTAHEKLRYMAYHDPLTGLINRRIMETILEREFAREARYPKYLSVVFIDLDKFKAVNDTYGHDCGDEILKYVANQLVAMSRDIDVVCRYAGDEFVMILPETTPQSAVTLLDRIQSHLASHPLKTGTLTVPVSLSYGVASTVETKILEPAQLLKRADERLYEAKRSK